MTAPQVGDLLNATHPCSCADCDLASRVNGERVQLLAAGTVTPTPGPGSRWASKFQSRPWLGMGR